MTDTKAERWFLFGGMTEMQKNYIWLMGSYPDYQMFQGRGKRSPKLVYACDHDEKELFIFGYSNPPYFMLDRWLVKGQAPHSYNLTEAGLLAFKYLRSSGGVYSTRFREGRLTK